MKYKFILWLSYHFRGGPKMFISNYLLEVKLTELCNFVIQFLKISCRMFMSNNG